MSTNVSWMLELAIVKEREGDFRALLAEMVNAAAANEPGTLGYECSTNAEGTHCHIHERYVDSAAAVAHLGTFGEKFAGRFLEILKPVRLIVYGNPSADVRNALAGFNPVFMQSVGGFSR